MQQRSQFLIGENPTLTLCTGSYVQETLIAFQDVKGINTRCSSNKGYHDFRDPAAKPEISCASYTCFGPAAVIEAATLSTARSVAVWMMKQHGAEAFLRFGVMPGIRFQGIYNDLKYIDYGNHNIDR